MDNDQPPLPASPNSSPASAGRFLSRESRISLVAGLLMGQMVLGISTHHQGSVLGLVLALICLMSASASLMLFMLGWRGRSAGQSYSPCLHAWLGMLGLGVLVSLQAAELF